MKKASLFVFSIMLLASSSTIFAEQNPELLLTEDVVKSAEKDFDALYELWLSKVFEGNLSLYKGFDSHWDKEANQHAFIEGFSQFCTHVGDFAVVSSQEELRGVWVECLNKEKQVLARIYTKDGFYRYESPSTIASNLAIEEARENSIAEILKAEKLNGPTGGLEYDGQKYRFLRIGDLDSSERLIIELKATGYHSLEHISKLELLPLHYSYRVQQATLTNGGEKLTDLELMVLQGDGSISPWGKDWFKFVVLDEETNQPYTLARRAFPDYIYFDPVADWQHLENQPISSNLAEVLQKQHREELMKDIGLAIAEAKEEDWFNHIPSGTPSNLHRVAIINVLKSMKRGAHCTLNQSIKFGVNYLKPLVMCSAAEQELALLYSNYPITKESTPLAYYNLLDLVRRDVFDDRWVNASDN